MADTETTDLTELTTPASDDFLHIVDVSDTTFSAEGTDKKITYTSLLATGWIPSGETWSATDANTISIAGADLTGILQKGDKIKVTNNSAVKYFYISTTPAFSTNTTFDVTGETDLVAGAITLPYYSHADCPQGFKRGQDWFNAVGTLGADQTITDATVTALDLEASINPNGDWDDDTNVFTAPIAGLYQISASLVFDSSVTVTRGRLEIITTSTNHYVDIDATRTRMLNNSVVVRLAKGNIVTFRAFGDVASGSVVIDETTNFGIAFIGL